VLFGSNKTHQEIGGGRVVPVWDLYRMIAKDILAIGKPEGYAMPEQFSLLRTMQFTFYWATPEKLENSQE